MADPVIPEAPAPAPVAPAAPAPAPAPEAPAPAAPAPEAPAPAPEAAAPAAPEAPAREPSLLETAAVPGTEKEGDGDKPAEKPAEPPKPEGEKAPDAPAAEPPKPDDKPVEAKPDDKPAEPAQAEPLEYKYELPETIKLDDAGRTELHSVIDEYRKNPANLQPLIDYAARRDEGIARAVATEQHRFFNETKTQWRNQVMADEQLGGAGHRTAMGTIARVRDLFVSSAPRGSERYTAELREFTQALDATGAGDHPAVLRFIHNIGRFIDEPAVPAQDIRPAPQPRPRGGAPLYDNPRSRLNGRE